MDIPQHIAFILDGNRRWAKDRGLPAWQGHLKALDTLDELVYWCRETGVKYLTVYAFSTENWGRPEEELGHLFGEVLTEGVTEKFPRLHEQNIRVNVLGRLDRFPPKMQTAIGDIIEKTKSNTGLVFNWCLDYGGRSELVRAGQEITRQQIPADQITEDIVSAHLYSAGVPDPDLVIRTSGEQRLSGFLLWQNAYAELYFPKVYFPAFTKTDFDEALTWYAGRDRRYGK